MDEKFRAACYRSAMLRHSSNHYASETAMRLAFALQRRKLRPEVRRLMLRQAISLRMSD